MPATIPRVIQAIRTQTASEEAAIAMRGVHIRSDDDEVIYPSFPDA